MKLSRLASSIAESPTLKLNEEARLLRERGEPVIHLGIGEPKNRTPQAAMTSGGARLAQGDVKYAPAEGIPSLRKAIVRYTEENYGCRVAPENVIVCVGAKHALFNVLFTLLDPRDEVILLAPYWVSYPEMVRMVGGTPVVVTPADEGFHPRLAEIERAVTAHTRAVMVNSPNNPSGVMFSEEFIAELVDFCERRDIFVIMDDIYHQLVFDGKRAPSAYRHTRRDIESTGIISVNGVSKTYGMTGFRIGWAVAGRRLVEVMTNVQGQTVTCASVVSQTAAEGALSGARNEIETLRQAIEQNRNLMLRELGALARLKTRRPDGTFYCLPDFRAYQGDSLELSRFLLHKALVVTVPGREFGVEGHLRLSYAGTPQDVTEGVSRIRWALDPDAPSEILMGDRKAVRDW